MHKPIALVVALVLAPIVGAFLLVNHSSGSAHAAASSAPAIGGDSPPWYAQVRAEYVVLYGNRDQSFTTFTIMNRSLTKSLFLGDVWAMGPDGLAEVLSVHTGLNGIELPPLGSVDVAVDSTSFPGLQPELEIGDRGLESIAVSWIGPKDALRLSAGILRNQPGTLDNRVMTWIEGHVVTK